MEYYYIRDQMGLELKFMAMPTLQILNFGPLDLSPLNITK